MSKEDAQGFGDLEEYDDEDLVEELLRRAGKFSDEQLRAEVSRVLSEHPTPEAAWETVDKRVNEAVTSILHLIDTEAEKSAVLLAVREELLDHTDQNTEGNGTED